MILPEFNNGCQLWTSVLGEKTRNKVPRWSFLQVLHAQNISIASDLFLSHCYSIKSSYLLVTEHWILLSNTSETNKCWRQAVLCNEQPDTPALEPNRQYVTEILPADAASQRATKLFTACWAQWTWEVRKVGIYFVQQDLEKPSLTKIGCVLTTPSSS